MHAPHRPPKNHQLRGDNTLHVIAVVSNPVRYSSRYRLYEEFAERMEAHDEVHLVTVEHAFGDRHHEVTQEEHPDHVRVRGSSELWHKENLINLGIRSLPRDWKYAAWIDADVEFYNKDWAQETLHQLQHYQVVQLFETAVDLGPRNNVVQLHHGFCSQHVKGAPRVLNAGPYGAGGKVFWHPGFAWACKREWYENVGGLIDWGVLGAGDHHMSLSLIGAAKESMPGGLHPNYVKRVLDWESRCRRAAQGNVGFVEGSLLHHWHGSKKKRFYIERWETLKKHQFDPDADIRYDAQGLLELSGNKPGLRDDIRAYFRSRDEDGRNED